MTDNESNKPAMLGHCERFYDLLYENAENEDINGTEFRVFRGYLTTMFKTLELPSGYYAPMRRLLEHHGCIQVLQPGKRGGITAVVVLLQRPSEVEGFAVTTSFTRGLTRPQEYAKLRQDVDAVLKTLGGINLAEALVNIESRLRALEKQLTEIGTQAR